jgi:hypothetical protein
MTITTKKANKKSWQLFSRGNGTYGPSALIGSKLPLPVDELAEKRKKWHLSKYNSKIKQYNSGCAEGFKKGSQSNEDGNLIRFSVRLKRDRNNIEL